MKLFILHFIIAWTIQEVMYSQLTKYSKYKKRNYLTATVILRGCTCTEQLVNTQLARIVIIYATLSHTSFCLFSKWRDFLNLSIKSTVFKIWKEQSKLKELHSQIFVKQTSCIYIHVLHVICTGLVPVTYIAYHMKQTI